MALKAQWNLVLRLLVDNGVKRKRHVDTTCLGTLISISQMHQVASVG